MKVAPPMGRGLKLRLARIGPARESGGGGNSRCDRVTAAQKKVVKEMT